MQKMPKINCTILAYFNTIFLIVFLFLVIIYTGNTGGMGQEMETKPKLEMLKRIVKLEEWSECARVWRRSDRTGFHLDEWAIKGGQNSTYEKLGGRR
jgi:hypothetical protein